MDKICKKCGHKKDEEEFFFRNKKENIRHGYCKECKRKLDLESYHGNKHNRRDKIRANSIEQIAKAKAFVRSVKQNGDCKKCGDKRWYVLDFHHLKNKEWNMSDLCARGSSIERIKKEIKKCILLCSNCHREEHYLNGSEAN